MKKACIVLSITLIIILSFIGVYLPTQPKVEKEYLRMHVRANSNEQIDQQVKYEVKERVVEFLTPYIAECDTKQKAQKMLSKNLSNIELVANEVLEKNGFNYTSKASIKNQHFPTRVYEELTLKEGFYDALIIELGKAEGNNWWCVVYPPLCFVEGGAGYVYKSKIAQIINDFLSKRSK